MNDTESTDATPDDTTSAPQVAAAETHAIRYVPYEELLLEYKFWANPRTHTGMGDADIQDLADSILRGTSSSGDEENVQTIAGIRSPLEVVMIESNGDAVNLVIDGQRRHKAIEVAKLPPDTLIPVYDLEPEPVKWTRELADFYLLRALDTVGTRRDLSSSELVESAARLRDSKDKETGKPLTLAKIAAAIGRSESWVSRFLAARHNATPKLLHQWQKGEITDEQFKDLAATKDPERQEEHAKAVVDARASGDKSTARALARENKILERTTEPAKHKEAKADPAPAAAPRAKAPEQIEIPETAPPAAPKPEPRKIPSFAIVEDMLDMATRKPPTHDYVKGLLDGVRWASGVMDAGKFGKPWLAYMNHVQGKAPKAPKATSAKPPSGSKAKPKAAAGKGKPSKKRR